jgi:RNA polymerase sigma factor (TIGR02999 family)
MSRHEAHVPASSSDGSSGQRSIPQELFTALYEDLRRIAARELKRNAAVTLSPTTLLHEAYLRLSPQASATFGDKASFMGYAARAMRALIIDHLRSRHAQKRGGGFQITTLPDELPYASAEDLEVEKVGEAMEALAAADPRLAQCVDLKFFCGFSLVEIAKMWNTSERTVQRDWEKARVLLYRMIKGQQHPNSVAHEAEP